MTTTPDPAGPRAYDVLSLGVYCVDILVKPVRCLPPPGGLEEIDEYDLQTGGCANNAAIAMARLGLRVATLGRVGEDRMGDIVLGDLRANGIDTRHMMRDRDSHTSMSVVLIKDNGERSFLHHRGANLKLSAADVPEGALGTARALQIGGAFLIPLLDGEPMAQLLRRARQEGVLTFVDTAVDTQGNRMDVVRAALPYMDYFLPSEAEATGMTGSSDPEQMAERLLAEGVGAVCIKLGERGCLVADREGARYVPAYQVQPMDTCGAGDTFTGGFVAGILKGLGMAGAARLANAVGAMCVTGLGATAALGTWEETLAFMQRAPVRG
ncbi:MAG: carbohydrate kinase family protein [Anaerolineae bacterium]